MPKVLITGSSGYLGRTLLKFSPESMPVLAHFRHHQPDDYGHNVRFIHLDLLDSDWRPLSRFRPDIIIHTAAMASIDECEIHPDMARRLNFDVTCRLLSFAKKHHIRFLFISSDVIFDGKKGNYNEQDSPVPLNVYAKTKSDTEQYILNQHADTVIIRPALFYGLALNGRPSYTEIMLSNLYAGKQVYVFTDQYRTPVLVTDLVKGIWEMATHSYRGILHLGGPQKVNRLELGQMLCQLFNLDENLLIPVKSGEARLKAIRPLDCSLDISLARSLLKTTFADLQTGLRLVYH